MGSTIEQFRKNIHIKKDGNNTKKRGREAMKNTAAVFCEECGDFEEYTVKSTRETVTVRGITFSYVEKSAYCTRCGQPVYVPEINDENVCAQEDAYRNAAGLISIIEIRQILEKYDIGAAPLALLLGFGEVTITRYLSGQLPSKKNSEILLHINASIDAMEGYLESGKEKITSLAYNKCHGAIERLKEYNNEEKIYVVARYLLRKAVDITPLALQKLLYFSQAFYEAIFGTELFSNRCQAWAYGPVYPEIYNAYKAYSGDPIGRPQDMEQAEQLTTKEVSLLDAVVNTFGSCSGLVLSKITHSERPWIEARGNLHPEDKSTTVIDPDVIRSYFREVVHKYDIVNPCDISRYCDAMRGQTKN